MSSYSTTDFEAERASLRKQLQTAETAQERREVMRAMAALERKEHAETYEKLAKE
ncbi:hypothetical protein [Haladaptatus sp. DYF46]|uniref:hypothetical protein n=1 Tax=Haladaptatus sp. DYF46 TaxID=2886041 RepID=UPI001E47F751|nr:hypothetical protein [Haladaptatus sp. DYF46]